jgi:hypothetical protein
MPPNYWKFYPPYNVPHTTSEEERADYRKYYPFYNMPHTISEEERADYWKYYPDKHMSWLSSAFFKQFNQNILLNVKFEKSIEQQHINLFAFVEGQKVQFCRYLSSFVGFSSLGQNLVS